jgi:hypothetical protein
MPRLISWLLATVASFVTAIVVASPLPAQAQTIRILYRTSIYTGDVDQAGTNDDVRLQLIGSNGDTEVSAVIDNPGDDFERHSRTTYTFPSRTFDLGTIYAVYVYYDASDIAEAWYLSTVQVTKFVSTDGGYRYAPIASFGGSYSNWAWQGLNVINCFRL